MHKDGQKTKTIGLLVGEEGSLGATDAIIYESVHINSKLFSKPARPSRTASPSTPSMQDRLGLHSFRRCDEVEYLNAEEGETYQAVVYGVIYHEPEEELARKVAARPLRHERPRELPVLPRCVAGVAAHPQGDGALGRLRPRQ